MTTFGPHDARYRASLQRLSGCRWLRPDAELEALTPASLDWLRERLDELRASLHPFARDEEALAALAFATERSARATCARWTAAWEAPDLAPSPVIAALDEAAARSKTRLQRLLDADEGRALQREIQRALAATCEAPSPWFEELRTHEESARKLRRYVYPREPGLQHPAAFAVEQHLRWELAFGDDDATPSPWAPIVAMFERGAWPVLLPDATVLVYVPVLAGGRLVPEPSKAPGKRRFPKRAPTPARMVSMFPSLERFGVSSPPSLVEYEAQTMMLGRIAAVRPTPREPAAPTPRPPGDDDAKG